MADRRGWPCHRPDNAKLECACEGRTISRRRRHRSRTPRSPSRRSRSPTSRNRRSPNPTSPSPRSRRGWRRARARNRSPVPRSPSPSPRSRNRTNRSPTNRTRTSRNRRSRTRTSRTRRTRSPDRSWRTPSRTNPSPMSPNRTSPTRARSSTTPIQRSPSPTSRIRRSPIPRSPTRGLSSTGSGCARGGGRSSPRAWPGGARHGRAPAACPRSAPALARAPARGRRPGGGAGRLGGGGVGVLSTRTIGARRGGGSGPPRGTIAGPATAVVVASTATAPALAVKAPAPAPATSSAIRSAVGAPAPVAPGGRRPRGERQRHDRGRRGAQRQPRPVDELADRAFGDAQLARHLVLAAALDRDPQQRLALALRQGREARQRLPHDRAALHLLLGRRPAAQRVLELRVVVAGDAQLVQRGVVDDPVQPRAQVAHLIAALECAPGGQVRLLARVLGARLGQIPAGGAQQHAAVALDDRLERPLVPGARKYDQPLVGLGAQQDGGRRRKWHAPATRECRRALRRKTEGGSGVLGQEFQS